MSQALTPRHTGDGPAWSATAALPAALGAWANAVGTRNVVCDAPALGRAQMNVTAFEGRIDAIVLPANVEEVGAVVRIARRFRVPLYPLSTGKNWGLGSRLPVVSGSVVVDLGRMNAIRALSGDELYATVEPGVTQRQLHETITARGLPVTMNVTGSSADSSIVGNALERGIGYFGLRADETSNLEVVLGTGEILRTGFGHVRNSHLAPLYRHGIGPSMDGLFFQSNLGIVTAATVALRPAAPRYAAAMVSVDSDAHLPALIGALAAARRAGAFDSVVHVGDRSRARITLAPLVAAALERDLALTPAEARGAAIALLDRHGFGAWSGLIGLSGTPGRIREALRDIRARMRGLGRVRLVDDRRLAWARKIARALGFLPSMKKTAAVLEAVSPLYQLTRGVPTDAAVHSVGFAAGDNARTVDPDQGRAGMFYCLPLMPLSAAAAEEALLKIRRLGGTHGIDTSVTFNVIDARVLEAVVTLPFDRSDPDAVQRARRCNDEMRRAFLRMGFNPYRVDIEAMGDVVCPGDLFWQKALALKSVFDPDGIIASRRYCLA